MSNSGENVQVNKVAVIGAGSWGTAIAGVLSGKGQRTVLWGHNPQHVKLLERERENIKYLPGFSFPPSLEISADLEATVSGAEIVCMVVPSHGYRAVFEQLVPFLENGVSIVSAVKGIENSSL
ncbi:MAG: NAD(P)-binding domain-containing protein, partial [Thermodesulfobacteriota bacterium]